MPKYMSRVQFEQMKVLKKRKSTNLAIAKALGVSPATVSRNLRYNSYEDYLTSMYKRNSKSQKEIEEKSGPVKTVGKKCRECKQSKDLSDFDKNKLAKDGHTSICKSCRRERQRAYYNKAVGNVFEGMSGRYHEPPVIEVVKKIQDVPKPNDTIRVNEYVYVGKYKGKVYEGTVVAIEDNGDRPDYIVRIRTWYGYKKIRVHSCDVFRKED